VKTIIFDLDGTLIDSAQSILVSMQRAFESCGLVPVLPLEASLIGPPLRETLQRLSPESDSAQIEQLAQSFIDSYDEQGCLEVHPFPGIDEMLRDLKQRGFALHIVTNKRAYPTQKILTHLCWNELFGCVYSIDSFPGPAWNKSQLLRRLLIEEGLRSDDCVYVGDREEDAVAASENGLAFIWADWEASWVASMRRLFR
jgi:phosphoglycolate phosphatase